MDEAREGRQVAESALKRRVVELEWLVRFGESLHANRDADAMFQWLCRELERFSPVQGVELASLPGGPVVRVGVAAGTRTAPGRDSRSIARRWSERLASRCRLRIPAAAVKVKRLPTLAAAENGRDGRIPAPGRTIETSFFHEGELVGLLAVNVPVAAVENRRIDALIASVAGQIGLFLHRSADLEKIRSLAKHDALTGLLNYLSFQDVFEREFERYRRHARNMSLLLVDLDNFKRINDTFGHQVGDQVLRKVAKILTANLRKTDCAFRYGGDEFLVLMAETDASRASILAQRIRTTVSREIRGIPPCEFSVSTSIGIADCTSLTSSEREELLLRADAALYQAKNAGRDRIQVAPATIASTAARVNFHDSRFFRPAAAPVRLSQRAL